MARLSLIRFAFDKRGETPAHELTDSFILAKRRAWEASEKAAGRVPPIWEGVNTMSFQKDGGSPQDQMNGIIKDLRTNKMGRNEATLRAKRIHDDHFFKVDATDGTGKPLSDTQQ